MSARKSRLPPQEQLQVFQRLVQLSNSPLVRTVVSTVTHHQLVIVGLIFVITMVFTSRDNAPWVTVRREVAIEFYSAVSQSLAALLGLLIVFLTFRIQAIASQRLDHYRALQSQIDQLIRLTQDLPSELQPFDQELAEIIEYFVPLQMKDFSMWASDQPSWDQSVIKFRNAEARINSKLPRAARLHLQQILLVLNNVDEILEVFSGLYIGILGMSRTVVAIAKLSFLLGFSLVCLLLFGIVGLQSEFPDLSLPVVVALAVWVLIAILELVFDAWSLYDELRGP